MHFRRMIAISPLVLAALSCSSSLEPKSNVTLLVTNASCAPGPCMAQEVLAFPSNQPETPGGDWSLDLGTMTGPQLCVTIPISATFLVSGPGETTTFDWTTAKPVSLGVQQPSELAEVCIAHHVRVRAGHGRWMEHHASGGNTSGSSTVCTP